MLADDPTELVQQLARNAQDALRRLAHNLGEDAKQEAAHRSSPKERKDPRPPRALAPSARASNLAGNTSGGGLSSGVSGASHSRRGGGPQGAGADKYLSPGGGWNGSAVGNGGPTYTTPLPKDRRQAGGRKKGGGVDKLSTGEDVTPDLPAEELQRLEAIRAQMRNMMGSLSSGY